jgi:hypothetical protein
LRLRSILEVRHSSSKQGYACNPSLRKARALELQAKTFARRPEINFSN